MYHIVINKGAHVKYSADILLSWGGGLEPPLAHTHGHPWLLIVNLLTCFVNRYLREAFNSALPHPRTLARWYSTVDASPGFCIEAFNALKDKSAEGNPLICSLIVDEMAIRKKVEWDGNKVMGYVDFGQGVDNQRVAKDAFVFMLVSINMNWRLPLGYFLVDGISGEQRGVLVTRCLHLLHEKNVS